MRRLLSEGTTRAGWRRQAVPKRLRAALQPPDVDDALHHGHVGQHGQQPQGPGQRRVAEEQAGQLRELHNLRKNVEHIKDIVSMQQSYAKVSGFIESVSLADLVEDAARLNSESLRRRSVQVRREYESLPPLLLDKHRVLQILINLIRNGAHALEANPSDDRWLTLRVRRAGADPLRRPRRHRAAAGDRGAEGAAAGPQIGRAHV